MSEVATKRELEPLDLVAFVGLGLLVGGVYWIYRPAALIVLGVCLLILSFLLSIKPRPRAARGEEG